MPLLQRPDDLEAGPGSTEEWPLIFRFYHVMQGQAARIGVTCLGAVPPPGHRRRPEIAYSDCAGSKNIYTTGGTNGAGKDLAAAGDDGGRDAFSG